MFFDDFRRDIDIRWEQSLFGSFCFGHIEEDAVMRAPEGMDDGIMADTEDAVASEVWRNVTGSIIVDRGTFDWSDHKAVTHVMSWADTPGCTVSIRREGDRYAYEVARRVA